MGAEALFRVELAFLGPAETCRLILTRRDPSTASAFGARQLRRGIWEARIRRNLRPGLSLGRRRVRRIGCKCHSRHGYRVQQRRLEILDRKLTFTLRGLERDRLVKRTVFPTTPPRVDYELTGLGRTLWQAVEPLSLWARAHVGEIFTSREQFGGKDAA